MKGLSIRLSICLCLLIILLFSYVHKHNSLTKLRLSIPKVKREIRELQEENIALMFELEQFEGPIHLMELARRPEFSHLKNPLVKDVLLCIEGKTILPLEDRETNGQLLTAPRVTLAAALP